MADGSGILSKVREGLLETTKEVAKGVVKAPLELVQAAGEQLSGQQFVQRQKQDKTETQQKLAQTRSQLHKQIENSTSSPKPSEEYHTAKREQQTGISEFAPQKTSLQQSSSMPPTRKGTKETGKMHG